MSFLREKSEDLAEKKAVRAMRSGEIVFIKERIQKVKVLIIKRRLREALEELRSLEDFLDELWAERAFEEVTAW